MNSGRKKARVSGLARMAVEMAERNGKGFGYEVAVIRGLSAKIESLKGHQSARARKHLDTGRRFGAERLRLRLRLLQLSLRVLGEHRQE